MNPGDCHPVGEEEYEEATKIAADVLAWVKGTLAAGVAGDDKSQFTR
jgi:hypothetical protein